MYLTFLHLFYYANPCTTHSICITSLHSGFALLPRLQLLLSGLVIWLIAAVSDMERQLTRRLEEEGYGMPRSQFLSFSLLFKTFHSRFMYSDKTEVWVCLHQWKRHTSANSVSPQHSSCSGQGNKSWLIWLSINNPLLELNPSLVIDIFLLVHVSIWYSTSFLKRNRH